MQVIHLVVLFFCITTMRCERQKDQGELQDISEQVTNNILFNTEVRGKGAEDWVSFKAIGLYFFLTTKVTRGVSEGKEG